MLATGIRTSLRARSWPKQPARILSSKLKQGFGRLGPQYSVHIRYECSSRISESILPSFMGTVREAYARRLAQHFHEGASVYAYVDPSRPERSVLLPGVELREWSLIGITALVTVGASIAAFAL